MVAEPIVPENVYENELADLWVGSSFDPTDELSFFRKFIQEHGQPALELGAGAGRLLVKLRSEGYDVDGLEPSLSLSSLTKKRLLEQHLPGSILTESMQKFSASRLYQTIFASRGVFQLVVDHKNIRASLKSIWSALAPNGSVAISFVGLSTEVDNETTDWLPLNPDRPHEGSIGANYLWRRLSIIAGVEVVELAQASARPRRFATVRTKCYNVETACKTFFSAKFDVLTTVATSDRDFILVCRKRGF